MGAYEFAVIFGSTVQHDCMKAWMIGHLLSFTSVVSTCSNHLIFSCLWSWGVILSVYLEYGCFHTRVRYILLLPSDAELDVNYQSGVSFVEKVGCSVPQCDGYEVLVR